MKQKFPQIREDGTFCVIAKITTSQNAAGLENEITQWCKDWVTENRIWQFSGEKLNYFDAFLGPPYVVTLKPNELWLRFEGVTSTYWWKDWLVRIINNITQAFPILQHSIEFENCDEQRD